MVVPHQPLKWQSQPFHRKKKLSGNGSKNNIKRAYYVENMKNDLGKIRASWWTEISEKWSREKIGIKRRKKKKEEKRKSKKGSPKLLTKSKEQYQVATISKQDEE